MSVILNEFAVNCDPRTDPTIHSKLNCDVLAGGKSPGFPRRFLIAEM